MSIALRYAIVLVTILGLLSCTDNGRADLPDGLQSDPTAVDADAAKARVLKWIDDYREDQVLFHDDDVASLRKELADDSPEEVHRWWSKTTKIRAALESSQWKETREWFRKFLRVQAIFSDEEIDELRTRAWNATQRESSRELKDTMAEIGDYRTDLMRGAADNHAMREYKLTALRKHQTAQPALTAKAAAFATNRTPVQPRPPRYSPPPPLVTSREVARWSVARIFWRW